MWKIIWMIGLPAGIAIFIVMSLLIGVRGYAEIRDLLEELKQNGQTPPDK